MPSRFALALLGALVFAQAAGAAILTFEVQLTGAAEVPGPGDPDGSGSATLMIDDVANTISWAITVSNLDSVVAIHIHPGVAGATGAPIVDFMGQLSGSGLADADLASVAANPTAFYLNVHTSAFTGGAIRGQLSPVPEPAALALLAAGAGIAAIRRRR